VGRSVWPTGPDRADRRFLQAASRRSGCIRHRASLADPLQPAARSWAEGAGHRGAQCRRHRALGSGGSASWAAGTPSDGRACAHPRAGLCNGVLPQARGRPGVVSDRRGARAGLRRLYRDQAQARLRHRRGRSGLPVDPPCRGRNHDNYGRCQSRLRRDRRDPCRTADRGPRHCLVRGARPTRIYKGTGR
jgi:hypothetical protein